MSIPLDRVHLDAEHLEAENRRFAGTTGISRAAADLRLRPAFRDVRTGRVEISRFADGRPAPLHLLEGLPEEWGLAHDEDGRLSRLKVDIVCGFVRGDRFFTRSEAAALATASHASGRPQNETGTP